MSVWTSDAVAALLHAGASPNVVDSNNATPLHFAVRNNYTATVAALLSAGAHVNVADNSGSTPLPR